VRSDGRLGILVGIEGRSPALFRPTLWADRRELLSDVDGNHNKTAIFDLRLPAIALPRAGAATWLPQCTAAEIFTQIWRKIGVQKCLLRPQPMNMNEYSGDLTFNSSFIWFLLHESVGTMHFKIVHI
jgi:hypothetical protein